MTLREEIIGVGNVRDGTAKTILGIINQATLTHYERRPMTEFEHLAIIIAIPGSLLMAWFFHHFDLDAALRRGGRRGSFRRSSGIRIRRNRRF